MIAALLALYPAALGADVAWQLEAAEGWAAAELAAVEALADRLPEPYRHPRRPVTLRRAAAQPLPDDLTALHTVALPSRRGRVITLQIDGLEAEVARWAEAHGEAVDAAALARDLLQRQLAHALTHRVDAERGWSREESWWALSGWGGLPRVPAEASVWSFALEQGRESPLEDLATLSERYFVPAALPGELEVHPACRAPSKWGWLAERAGPAAEPPDCGALAAPDLDPDEIDWVELLYIKASAHSPASIAGHTLVNVVYAPDALGLRRIDTFGLVGQTGGLEAGPAFILRGITGGFPSKVVWEPYASATMRYTLREDRDLYRFRFVLDPAGEQAMLARLDELRQGWERPYLFFQRNCTQLPRQLAEAALGEPLRLPDAAGPDAVLGALDRAGLLEALPRESLGEFSVSARADAARALRAEAAGLLLAAHPGRAAALEAAFDGAREADPERRIGAYLALGDLAGELGRASSPSFAELDRYLSWSDVIEQARVLLETGDMLTADPVVDALRTAKTVNRLEARASGVSVAREADPGAELLGSLDGGPPSGSSHTPLGRLSLYSAARLTGGQPTAWLGFSSQLYSSRLGEARRFSLAEGVEISLLYGELALGVSARELRSRQTLATLRRLGGRSAALHPGWYLRLMDLEQVLVSRRQLEADWAEAGALLALWPTGGRHSLMLSAGVAGRTNVGEGTSFDPLAPAGLAGGTALAAPVGLTARLGGAQALTGLELSAEWRPLWSAEAAWSEPSASAQGRLRLGEVQGRDLALSVEHRVRAAIAQGEPTSLVQEARLSLWIEPY